MRFGILPLLLLVAFLGLNAHGSAPGTSAQTPQPTLDAAVENNYPGLLTFTLSAEAAGEISGATLYYAVVGRGSSAVSRPEIAEPSTTVSVSVEVETNSQNSFIPVGSEFLYHWQLTLTDGSVVVGDDATFFYLSPDLEWQTAENDFMEVYYHGDRADLADGYLAAAAETYEVFGELLAIELTRLPVRVILFAAESELNEARPSRGETFDAAVTTCGSRVADDIVYVIPISCGGGDPTDTLRHEFAHILTAEAGESALVTMPAWLDEGTAVLAQSDPGDNYIGAFNTAARSDNLIPFVQMSTASDRASQVNLFYGQSFAMVVYLLDLGGPAAFAELFATAKAGSRFNDALETVYGFDLAGFEAAFRESYGLAAAGQTTPVAPTQPAAQGPEPTPVPDGPSQSDSGGQDSGLSRTTLGIIGLAVLFALIAVFFYLLSLMLQGRRKPPRYPVSGAPPSESPSDEWTRPPD